MINLKTAAAIICLVPIPSFAFPLTGGPVMKVDRIGQDVRVVCDEYGSCWQTGPGYGYGYRPPTKWEQKAFLPSWSGKEGQLSKPSVSGAVIDGTRYSSRRVSS